MSASKVGGRRSFARVRAGEEVDLPARPVTVSVFEPGELRRGDGVLDVDVRVVCSSGTYVRALARDLGEALGVGGHLTKLRRTRVGGFALDRARTLDELAERLDVIGIGNVARSSFPSLTLDETRARMARHGRALDDLVLPSSGAATALFDPSGAFLALYEQRGSAARAVAVFV